MNMKKGNVGKSRENIAKTFRVAGRIVKKS